MSASDPATYGYVRVSKGDHKLCQQIRALLNAGVGREQIFTDETNGTKRSGRPGLKAAFKALHPGSRLVVWKIDRLGRNLSELIQTTDLIRRKGAELVSLTEGIDTSNAHGEAMYHIIGVFAQLERDMIVERTKAGIAEAKERGKRPGRRSPLTAAKRLEIINHMLNGMSFEQIAPLVGLSKSTLYNYGADLRAEMAVAEAEEVGSD